MEDKSLVERQIILDSVKKHIIDECFLFIEYENKHIPVTANVQNIVLSYIQKGYYLISKEETISNPENTDIEISGINYVLRKQKHENKIQ